MSSRFDLKRVMLHQYRSIAACDVVLGPLTILVGPNGSGKSNFLDALRLTAQTLSENLDNALRERGGIGEVRRRSRGHATHFGVKLSFLAAGSHGQYAYQVEATGHGDYQVSHEELCVRKSGLIGTQYFVVRDGELLDSSQRVMPPITSDRLYLVAAAGIDAFRPVFDGLSAISVYNLNPDVMRQLQKPESGELLRRDGSNVASVIGRLHRDRPATKERIEAYLGQIVDGVTGVDRRGLGVWEAIEFRQRVVGDQQPWAFQDISMSDGTLRALGVLVALFGGATALASPVGIEEPEAALHPAAAGLLLESLRDSSEGRQVLVTTHSPDLIDTPSVTPAELLAVRASGGLTTLGRVDQAGQKAMRESLFTPGELLRVDQLLPAVDTPEQRELFS